MPGAVGLPVCLILCAGLGATPCTSRVVMSCSSGRQRDSGHSPSLRHLVFYPFMDVLPRPRRAACSERFLLLPSGATPQPVVALSPLPRPMHCGGRPGEGVVTVLPTWPCAVPLPLVAGALCWPWHVYIACGPALGGQAGHMEVDETQFLSCRSPGACLGTVCAQVALPRIKSL